MTNFTLSLVKSTFKIWNMKKMMEFDGGISWWTKNIKITIREVKFCVERRKDEHLILAAN